LNAWGFDEGVSGFWLLATGFWLLVAGREEWAFFWAKARGLTGILIPRAEARGY
jgi:hypothetical protein